MTKQTDEYIEIEGIRTMISGDTYNYLLKRYSADKSLVDRSDNEYYTKMYGHRDLIFPNYVYTDIAFVRYE